MNRAQGSPYRRALSAPGLLLFSLLLILLTSAQAQNGSSRPVARLVTLPPLTPVRKASCPQAVATAPVQNRTRTAAPISISASSIERRAFDLINAEREAKGEEPLVLDGELCRMARLHSEKMARLNFFDHTDPDGTDVVGRARALGIIDWSALAENIAYNQGTGDPVSVAVKSWMRSPGHRANILSERFTRSGIGVASTRDGRVYFTQVFMR